MFEVNVIGLSIATQCAVEAMRSQSDTGLIIHISSMSGHRVPDGTGGMYSATKHAVKALTEGLRRELRALNSNIRVCAISPGFVETEFAEVMTGDAQEAADLYARYQCLTAADVARSVSWVVQTPAHMQVHDILIRPTQQLS
jgi:NADP-dependent 3-hydroxy acid dehydrogenase YdfG